MVCLCRRMGGVGDECRTHHYRHHHRHHRRRYHHHSVHLFANLSIGIPPPNDAAVDERSVYDCLVGHGPKSLAPRFAQLLPQFLLQIRSRRRRYEGAPLVSMDLIVGEQLEDSDWDARRSHEPKSVQSQ